MNEYHELQNLRRWKVAAICMIWFLVGVLVGFGLGAVFGLIVKFYGG